MELRKMPPSELTALAQEIARDKFAALASLRAGTEKNSNKYRALKIYLAQVKTALAGRENKN